MSIQHSIPNNGILPIALKPKKTLLIGAGSVAKQKYQVLSESGFEVSIVAREIKDSFFTPLKEHIKIVDLNLAYIPSEGNINPSTYISQKFALLHGFELVIDASGDSNLGQFLYENRRKYGYLLNVVDVPHLCDFYFGAIARSGNVSVLVSSNGASPILAQSIRDKITNLLPKAIANFSYFLQRNRKKPLDSIQRADIKKASLENLGKVFIIGCGPGDFKSLTLRAFEAFSLLDVALIDNLVGREIWEYLQNLGIECISVGKQKGGISFKQEDINALMLKLAKEGKCVGRLKGGDPVIFGRVWEEGGFLAKEGIEVDCISGISSSLSGALSSGIIPTLRGVSSGVLIVSAHLRENVFHTEWLSWLKDSPYTLVVMMAYSFAERIVESARDLGINLSIPAAFISKVDSKEQKSVIGTLQELVQMARLCEKPAVLIIGEAVKKSLAMPYSGERIVLESLRSKENIEEAYNANIIVANERESHVYKEIALV